MPNRNRRDLVDELILVFAFAWFFVSGAFYLFAPPTSTFRFYETNIPAMLWGGVFLLGSVIACVGVFRRLLHVQRMGLMFVIIAGVVLTLNQFGLMFDPPPIWTRGGGTTAYGGFALIALVLWRKMKPRMELIDLAIDLEDREGDGG